MRVPTSLLGLALLAGCAPPPPPSPPPAPPPAVTAPPAPEPPPSAPQPPPSAPRIVETPPLTMATPAARDSDVPARPEDPYGASVWRIMKQNRRRFRSCYDEYLYRTSGINLRARVLLHFHIGRDGAVSKVSNAGSDLPSSEAMTCMVRAMYGISFLQPKAPLTVTYPFVFTPGGD